MTLNPPTTRRAKAAAVRTFSGTHPFRASHAGNPSRAVALIDAGCCPRCEGRLYPDVPLPGWRPAGSRATACRCIPVCEDCAYAEAMGEYVGTTVADAGIETEPTLPPEFEVHPVRYIARTNLLPPERWPVNRERMISGCALVSSALDGQSEVVEVRLGELVGRQHPGGWCDPDN